MTDPDGSKSCRGLKFIDGNDYALQFVDVSNPHDHDVDVQLPVDDPQATDYNRRYSTPACRAASGAISLSARTALERVGS